MQILKVYMSVNFDRFCKNMYYISNTPMKMQKFPFPSKFSQGHLESVPVFPLPNQGQALFLYLPS